MDNYSKSLHSYQLSLQNNVLEAINRNEIMDVDSSGKINLIISDIVNLQEKLRINTQNIAINQSLTFNINIISSFMNQINLLSPSLTEELSNIILSCFNNDISLINDFIKNITEICILNDTGYVRKADL